MQLTGCVQGIFVYWDCKVTKLLVAVFGRSQGDVDEDVPAKLAGSFGSRLVCSDRKEVITRLGRARRSGLAFIFVAVRR